MKYIDNRLNANIVKLEDANNNYTSANVEGALEEIDSKIKIIEANGYDDTQIRQNINDIKTEIGSTALNTDAINIKGAINEVNSKIEINKTNVEGALEEVNARINTIEANGYDDTQIRQNINDIKTELGTEELTTTDKTIKGAVNEINSQIKDIEQENKTRWESMIVNVKDFGAIGDGANDDTQAIKNALNYVRGKRMTLFFPKGVYVVSDTIVIDFEVVIKGAGCNYTDISMSSNIEKNVLDIVTGAYGITFEDISVSSRGDKNASKGININGYLACMSMFTNVSVSNCDVGIFINGNAYDASFNNITIRNCNFGLYDSGTDNIFSNFMITDCVEAMTLNGSRNNKYSNFKIMGASALYGVKIYGCGRNQFSNMEIQDFMQNGLHIKSCYNNHFGDWVIDNIGRVNCDSNENPINTINSVSVLFENSNLNNGSFISDTYKAIKFQNIPFKAVDSKNNNVVFEYNDDAFINTHDIDISSNGFKRSRNVNYYQELGVVTQSSPLKIPNDYNTICIIITTMHQVMTYYMPKYTYNDVPSGDIFISRYYDSNNFQCVRMNWSESNELSVLDATGNITDLSQINIKVIYN